MAHNSVLFSQLAVNELLLGPLLSIAGMVILQRVNDGVKRRFPTLKGGC